MQEVQELRNKIFEELDVTDYYNTYFDYPEEIDDFCSSIKEKFEDLKQRNYNNICFRFDTSSYTEYGDTYTDVRLIFSWERELSEEEIQKTKKQEAKKLEDEKIFSELCGKLSTNSIGSIIHNEDLRKLYLQGRIKI